MEMLEKEMAKETLMARGKAFYERRLKVLLEPQHEGEFLAIEPDSGQYFLGRTSVWQRWTRRGQLCRRSYFI